MQKPNKDDESIEMNEFIKKSRYDVEYNEKNDILIIRNFLSVDEQKDLHDLLNVNNNEKQHDDKICYDDKVCYSLDVKNVGTDRMIEDIIIKKRCTLLKTLRAKNPLATQLYHFVIKHLSFVYDDILCINYKNINENNVDRIIGNVSKDPFNRSFVNDIVIIIGYSAKFICSDKYSTKKFRVVVNSGDIISLSRNPDTDSTSYNFDIIDTSMWQAPPWFSRWCKNKKNNNNVYRNTLHFMKNSSGHSERLKEGNDNKCVIT